MNLIGSASAGTGIRSAADYLAPSVCAVDPSVPGICSMPIERYGLHTVEVLDAIARLAGSKKHQAVRTYDGSGSVPTNLGSIETLAQLFAASRDANHTFNIEYLERHIPQVNAFAIDLSALYGGTVSVHAFVSAGGVPPTPLHYDYSDAFTHQVYGRKRWRCYEYLDKPHFGPEGYKVNRAAVGTTTVDRILVEGDCLFVPMGGLHLVQSIPDSDSVHLAVSVKPLGFYHLISQSFPPELDHPSWTGLNFEAHSNRLAKSMFEATSRLSSADVMSRARNAVWQHIYTSFGHAPYQISNLGSCESSSRLNRALGRPLEVIDEETSINIRVLDPSLSGPIGRFNFRPSYISIPVKARLFAEMLTAGELDIPKLNESFGPASSAQLVQLAVEVGLFE